MRSFRSLTVAAATIVALSGCGSATASPTPFTLTKTCVRQELTVCTIVSSDISKLPPGTEIWYTAIGEDASNGLLAASISVAGGSTLGVCDFNYDGTPIAAKCTFTTGSGNLTGFHLAADVSRNGPPPDPKTIWTWVGTYWFGD
jgi:hypothetical protein